LSAGASGAKLGKFLAGSALWAWHLTKIAAEREVRQLFHDAQLELDDVFMAKVKSTPFKPAHLPFLFVFMDSPHMFESAFRLIWGPELSEITGQNLVDVFDHKTRCRVIEMALLLNVGDGVKELAFDKNGNIVTSEATQYLNKIPQVFQLYGNPKGSTAVHTVVESESHGLYEVRFARLPHKGDFYNLALEPAKVNLDKLKERYFTKFQALNLYYCEVNKHFYNTCPAFYRFKISPLIPESRPGGSLLNRVFEVEEYMGRLFIEELADMH
jgi:hypothetical protein